MYIRTKVHKTESGNHRYYAYLVSTRYSKKKGFAVQKTRKYLGRAFPFQREITLESTQKLVNTHEPIRELISLILQEHGFSVNSNDLYEKNSIMVDLKKGEIYSKETRQKVCLMVNQGTLCSENLGYLLKYNLPTTLSTTDQAKQLAKLLLRAGLLADPGIFPSIFQALASVNMSKQQSTMLNNTNQQCSTVN